LLLLLLLLLLRLLLLLTASRGMEDRLGATRPTSRRGRT